MLAASSVAASGTKDYKLLDHAWLANNALWDQYFFSTLSPHEGPLMQARNLKDVATGFLEEGEALLNPRIVPAGSSAGSGMIDGITSAAGYLNSASHLMIDGAFNVNSTSVEAWKALLSSMNLESVEFFHLADGSAVGKAGVVESAANPFSRMRRAAGASVESFNALQSRHGRWTGMRSLSEAEIASLAANIVDEIEARGPFLSVAEFVNRRPGGDKEQALKGPLQTAIDRTESINARFAADSRIYTAAQVAADGHAFPEALAGMSAVGAPGYLTQGDILSSVGSVISVRSDTFRVRGYGEAVDPADKVIARAWCEAVVQRVPEFVDAGDLPEAALDSLKEANKVFGRRFVVTGFRWLSSGEI
jgi:hypothetical protein